MSISRTQMTRLSKLLDEALSLSPAGRRQWLDALPPEDQPLLHTLREGLLMDDPGAAVDPRLDGPMSIPSTDGAADMSNSVRQSGERLGAYELLHLLGAGGMAEVWLARRADGVFDRHVALKIPRLGKVPKEMAERFARERRILAVLEYPGIARLYDAGVDDQGVPYFAMEYVQGEMLTKWCEARSLGVAEKLRVFLQVLEAVGHAHTHHVIHRDLKPSNILVTAQGDVRLLDFGVARLLQEEAGAPALTRLYGRPLTPEYASPELLHGESIDARSDIYSLGVVLHELLLGVRPGQRGGSVSAISAALPTEVRGILQKAMAVLPEDRYPDLASFAAALRPHASGGGGRLRIPPRARPYVAASAAVLVLAVVAVIAFRNPATPVPAFVPPPPTPAPLMAALLPPTIAVLPFIDLSEHHDQGYLSDGLAEELINLLTKIPGLSVTARASSFSFRGRKEDVLTIARQLNVDHILDGSVRRSGNRLRFSVQLVEASTGKAMWSEAYDRELKDIFDVQEDVANAVVNALKLRLLPKQSIPPSLRTQNTRAYEEYLLGRQYHDGYTLERQKRALAAFTRAAQLDPSFAAAHAAIAIVKVDIGAMTMDDKLYDQAIVEAERALAMDPGLVEAYVARARVRMEGYWDFTGAAADLAAAHAIDPNNAALLQSQAYYVCIVGDARQAVALQRQGVARNPLVSNLWEALGLTLMSVRDYPEARKALQRSEELSPYSDYRLQLRSRVELHAGNSAEALRLARAIPDVSQRDFMWALAAYSAGEVADSKAALQRLIDRAPDMYAVQIGMIYAWMGRSDEAFRWLNRAIDLHDPGLMDIRHIPELDSLRADARFRGLLSRMNLAA